MTTCHTIQLRLTAYLDGELTGDLGSVVRGHLRECAACRGVARDEAALRDALRMLPPVDPPASLWAGVQSQLAAAEVADARTPRWRRNLARWTDWLPWPPAPSHVAAGGLLAAAAAVMVYWRSGRDLAPPDPVEIASVPAVAASRDFQSPSPSPSLSAATTVLPPGDVTADLLAEPARTTESHARVIEELMQLASEASADWSPDQRAAFDGEVAALRAAIASAGPGRPQQRAQRALIRYLQGAAVRDVVALASGGTR